MESWRKRRTVISFYVRHVVDRWRPSTLGVQTRALDQKFGRGENSSKDGCIRDLLGINPYTWINSWWKIHGQDIWEALRKQWMNTIWDMTKNTQLSGVLPLIFGMRPGTLYFFLLGVKLWSGNDELFVLSRHTIRAKVLNMKRN